MRNVIIQQADLAAAIERKLAAMPTRKCGNPPKAFTPAMDATLLKHRRCQFPKTWAQLAEAFEMCEGTLRKRFRELTALDK